LFDFSRYITFTIYASRHNVYLSKSYVSKKTQHLIIWRQIHTLQRHSVESGASWSLELVYIKISERRRLEQQIQKTMISPHGSEVLPARP